MGRNTNNENHGRYKSGMGISTERTQGTIVYIYENKGGLNECGNYRPISTTHIVYKLRSCWITRELTRLMHIVTRIKKSGYNESISTIGAIVKIEQHIIQRGGNAAILLISLSKAFPI